MHMNKLNDRGTLVVERMLHVSEDLCNAHLLKEKFYEFMDSKNSEEARKRLQEFVVYASVVGLSEFSEHLCVISNWSGYILNNFDCRYTNGFTEGCNNKIKALKHIAFCYRNFHNLRQCILLTVNPQGPTPCRA